MNSRRYERPRLGGEPGTLGHLANARHRLQGVEGLACGLCSTGGVCCAFPT